MGGKGNMPDLRGLSADLAGYVKKDGEARKYKKKYNAGVAIGLGAIFLSTAVFIYLMFVLTSSFSVTRLALCGVAVALMAAVLIIVPIRLKRLQALYFGGAQDAAREYVDGIVKTIRDEQEK
jgi:hypothetical protein